MLGVPAAKLGGGIDNMCPLRRVEDHRAGPSALGILVPPGRRTFLILRPRSLSWDLVLVRLNGGNAFREITQNEAEALALALYDALGSAAANVDTSVEESVGPAGTAFQVYARMGAFRLLVCGRSPGQPYRPLLFPDAPSAQAAAAELRGILRPPENIEQEVYLNTRHFSR